MVLLVVAAAYTLLDFYAVGTSVSAINPVETIRQIIPRYGRELMFTLTYAFATTVLQVVIGSVLAVLAWFHSGTKIRWYVMFWLLPYFVPIAVFATAVHSWALLRLDLNGSWGWVLLLSLSTWQFLPFVFLVIYEHLRTISRVTWHALLGEGGGLREAISYLIWPKVAEVAGGIFLLRFLWMYTKVDTIFYLFQINSKFSLSFIQMPIFRSVSLGGSLDQETSSRAIVMTLAMIVLLLGVTASRKINTWIARKRRTSVTSTHHPVTQAIVTQEAAHTRSYCRGFPPRGILLAGATLAGLLLSLPIVVQVYCSFRPNSLITVVTGQDLLRAWCGFFSADSLFHGHLRWCLQSWVLAGCASVIFSTVGGLLAYVLYRDSRLAFRGKKSFLQLIPVAEYTIPLIAIALPVCLLAKRWNCDGWFCLYVKLLLAHGFFLWPFCFWLAFTYMGSLNDRTEAAAISEGAGLWHTLKIVVIPQLKGRVTAIFLLGFAISFNELIFSTYLINNPPFYTFPVGIVQVFSTIADGSSAAILFVLTTVTAAMSLALSRWTVRFASGSGQP